MNKPIFISRGEALPFMASLSVANSVYPFVACLIQCARMTNWWFSREVTCAPESYELHSFFFGQGRHREEDSTLAFEIQSISSWGLSDVPSNQIPALLAELFQSTRIKGVAIN